MTEVIDVAEAEQITGHPHSVAITSPDRATFVKGTCPEESKWWFNVLATFPKSKIRHKRSANSPYSTTPNIKRKSRYNSLIFAGIQSRKKL